MAQQVKAFVMADKLSPLPSIYGGQRQPITCTHTYMFTHTQNYHIYICTHKNTKHAHTCAHITHRNNHNNKIKIIKYSLLRYGPPFLLCGICSNVSIGWWACHMIKSMGNKQVVETLSTCPLPSSRVSRGSWHGRRWSRVVSGDDLLSQDRYTKWAWCQPLPFWATITVETALIQKVALQLLLGDIYYLNDGRVKHTQSGTIPIRNSPENTTQISNIC